MNNTAILTFATGIVIGTAGGYLLAPKPSADAVSTKERIAVLEKQLAAKTGDATGKAEPPAKGDAAVTGGEERANVMAPPFDDAKWKEQQKKREEKMKKMVADKLKLKVDEKLATMKQKLGLTDEQAEAIRPLLEKHLAGGDMMSMFMQMEQDGDLSPEERKKKGEAFFLDAINPAKKNAELDEGLMATLSPEQQAAYGLYKQEQRANSVEIAANKELGKIQGAMTLTDEQKDQAFSVLSTLANEDFEKPIPPFVHMASMPGAAEGMEKELGEQAAGEIKSLTAEVKARKSRRLEAMKGILSPEQYSIYESQQNDPANDMGEFMSEMGAGMMLMHEGMDDDEEAAAELLPDQP